MRSELLKERLEAALKHAAVADDIARGERLFKTIGGIAEGVPSTLSTLHKGVERVLAPAGPTVGNLLGRAGNLVAKDPARLRAAAGLLLLAPILSEGFNEGHQRSEAEIMNMRRNPERELTASLREAMEKKAAGPTWSGELFKGVGNAFGKTVAEGTLGLAGGAFGAIANLAAGPARTRLLESLLRTDPVLSDAVKRNPMAAQVIKEAFATMIRFAPSLSTDINAVRSFLREAAIGGGGVNYATIKNLIETEKAHRRE